ncbi:anthranilate synthase component II, variant [Sparganum proliferum]
MTGGATFLKSRRFPQSLGKQSERTCTGSEAGYGKWEQTEGPPSTSVPNRHKVRLGRAHSERRHEVSVKRNGGGRRPSVTPRDVPHFCEGVDQKVLPLPTRLPPPDWVDRLPSENSYEMRVLAESLAAAQREVLQRDFLARSNLGEGNNPSSSLTRIFLDAVERGDKSTVTRCLRCPQPVNVNCTNMLGRTAIQIAVDNENFEIVELLLQEPNIRIGDALLYAIQEGVYRIVEMLIDHHSITKEVLGTSWSKRVSRSEESHDFSADISPVILASICNQFEILQLLLSRGARIERPHRSNCSCNDCVMMNREDSLKYSLWRMNTYRALASPAWLSLTSPDPVLAAFKLSWELSNLASRENEFKEVFIQLSEQCKKYACDLLDQCRSTEEVLAVLNKSSDSSDNSDDEEGESSSVTDGIADRRYFRRQICRRRLHKEEQNSVQSYSSSQHRAVFGNDMHRIDISSEQLPFQPGFSRREVSQYTIVEKLDEVNEGLQTRPYEDPDLCSHRESRQQQGNEVNHSRSTGAILECKDKRSQIGSEDETIDEAVEDDLDSADEVSDDEGDEEEEDPSPLRLDRLKLAIKWEQKRATTVFAPDKDIKEGQLVIFFLHHRKLYVRLGAVGTFFKRWHLIPFYYPEGIARIPSPEFRSVVSENQQLQPL